MMEMYRKVVAVRRYFEDIVSRVREDREMGSKFQVMMFAGFRRRAKIYARSKQSAREVVLVKNEERII
jgi:hypothetical protein